MNWFSSFARRWRLALVGIAVAVISMLAAGWVIVAYDGEVYRAQKLKETTVGAQIMANAVTAALVFDDAKAIQEYLDAIRANPELNAAAVYRADGRLIAKMLRADADDVPVFAPGARAGIAGDFIVVTLPIIQAEDRVGTVYMRTLQEPWIRRISRYGALLLLFAMAALVMAVSITAQTNLRRANAELTETNTQLRVQIRERERAEDTLRQVQKMEVVGQLTGGIAHDFNNMLAIIIQSLSLLKRRAARGESNLTQYADYALEGANRAANLTKRLLAFSRQQALSPQPVDPNQLVSGMSELLRRTLGETVQIEIVLAGGAWRTKVDNHQLENAILNLAVNSRDAMPSGGRLTIETANVALDERYAANHSGLAAGQYAMIAVTDTGAGMSPEVLQKAFEPFFTTKAVGKGTGLGLSQVYGFVRQSGGHINLYSEIGQGTTVKIYLPRLFGAAETEAVAVEPELPLASGDITILVVEDEPSVRRLAIDGLVELGYRVLEADGAAAALRIIASHPEIKMLFTDIVMPEVNGRQLADQALKKRPDLKVLFTTGYTRNAVVHNGVVDPGVHLISKPFSLEQLSLKVRTILDLEPA